MENFPFPTKDNAKEELAKDLLYCKIPEGQRDSMANLAWDAGVQAAAEIRCQWPSASARAILSAKGVRILEEDRDCVIGNTRYFSDYYSGKKEVHLYLQSVRKWTEHHGLEFSQGQELILYHELFHHLECHEPDLISIDCTIPFMKIGNFSIGKQKIHALSEIGAYGFSRTCYELKHHLLRKEV